MKKLLIVDDDREMTELLRRYISDNGFACETCNSAKTAFDQAKKYKPHYVMLDVMLGHGLGYRVARQLRHDPELYQTPVLYVSSIDEDPEVNHAYQQGGDEFLSKPFKLDDLLSKLTALEQLRNRIRRPDTLTGLPQIESLKREIDHRLHRGEPFSCVLLTVRHSKEWALARSNRERAQVASHTAEFLRTELTSLGVYEHFVATAGAENFFMLIRISDEDRVLRQLPVRFGQTIHELHSSEEIRQNYIICAKRDSVFTGYPLMCLEHVVVRSDDHDCESAQDMMARLRRRHKRMVEKKPPRIFHVDQRLRPK